MINLNISSHQAIALTFVLIGATAYSTTAQTEAETTENTQPQINIQTVENAAPLSLSGQPFQPEALPLEKEPDSTRGFICPPNVTRTPENCDDRVPLTSRAYPWSAIGRLSSRQDGQDLGNCTATLIEKDWILTNAHCVINPETSQPYPGEELVFQPNLINGSSGLSNDEAKVIGGAVGTDFSEQIEPPNPQDWAILQLDQPLGDKYGALGWKAIESETLIANAEKFTLVGYSGDFPDPKQFLLLQAGPSLTPGIHEDCSIISEREDQVLTHDCDMRQGASGGPILSWIDDKPYIVAVNSAERANQVTGIGSENYAVHVARIEEWLSQEPEVEPEEQVPDDSADDEGEGLERGELEQQSR